MLTSSAAHGKVCCDEAISMHSLHNNCTSENEPENKLLTKLFCQRLWTVLVPNRVEVRGFGSTKVTCSRPFILDKRLFGSVFYCFLLVL